MTAPQNHPGVDAPRSTGPAGASQEQRVALPTRALLVWMLAAAMLIAGAWSAAVAIGPWDNAAFISGLIGIAVTTAVALAGVVMIMPWKPRPIADWMTLWLAGTVFRMFGTPAVLFLLYSAAPRALAVKPLVLSVALTYLVSVLAEAGIIASHVRRSLPPLR